MPCAYKLWVELVRKQTGFIYRQPGMSAKMMTFLYIRWSIFLIDVLEPIFNTFRDHFSDTVLEHVLDTLGDDSE